LADHLKLTGGSHAALELDSTGLNATGLAIKIVDQSGEDRATILIT